MDRSKRVKRGDGFLPDIGLPELEQLHRGEPHGKTRTMLQAAMRRKKGEILESISNAIGVAISTVHDWLLRLEEGGLERRHDRKSPGRPCRLSDEQWAALDRDIDKDPTESGFFRDTWTGRLVARRILNAFGIRYSDSGALKLTRRMNFSVRGVRPVPYNSATAKDLAEYVEETVRQVREYDRNGFKIVFIDFAGFADSPPPGAAYGAGAAGTRSRPTAPRRPSRSQEPLARARWTYSSTSLPTRRVQRPFWSTFGGSTEKSTQ